MVWQLFNLSFHDFMLRQHNQLTNLFVFICAKHLALYFVFSLSFVWAYELQFQDEFITGLGPWATFAWN